MDNFFELIDLTASTKPLLKNDMVFEMDDDNDDEFDPENTIKSVYNTTSSKYDGKLLVRDMFYVDMFCFEQTVNKEVVYWMPASHPISELLQFYGYPCVNRVEKNCIYGDVVIYDKESVDWCIDMIINSK